MSVSSEPAPAASGGAAGASPAAPHAAQRSSWSRLVETPMRDLLRGRITGRLDIPAMLDAEALPAPIASLILRTVRRTRLWRLEKVDVAKELIAHFRDALAAHQSVGAGAPALDVSQRLIADFGEEKQAARLIRRAKRRQRPLVWHAWRRTLQAAGGLTAVLLVTYAALAIRYWTGEPKITHDYLADLNTKALAVPPEEAAWPVHRDALLSLNVPKEWWGAKNTTLWRRPGEAGWSDTAAFLREHADAIARLREGSRRPGLGIVVGVSWDASNEPLFGGAPELDKLSQGGISAPTLAVLMPHVQWLKRAATLLHADAFLAAEQGDGARAAADVDAMLRIARQLREHDLLIADLVGVSIVAFASGTAASLAADYPDALGERSLREMGASLVRATDADLRVRFDGERRLMLDLLQRMYTDDGAGDGRPARQYEEAMAALGDSPWHDRAFAAAVGPASMLAQAGRKDMLREYDRMLALTQARAATPLWMLDDSAGAEPFGDRGWLGSTRYSLIDVIWPAMGTAARQSHLAAQQRDGARLGIAIELFRMANARYPSALSELQPEHIESLPLDVYDGKPIKYAITAEGKPLLYSIGNDRADNGGRLHLTIDGQPDNSSPMRWMPPGGVPGGEGRSARTPAAGSDWILYPPVRTPVKAPESEGE